MIILDTDTLTLAQKPDSAVGGHILRRIRSLPDDDPPATTSSPMKSKPVVGLPSWRKPERSACRSQPTAAWNSTSFLSGAFIILPFDDAAGERFEHLRSLRLRVGTMDLKIAAIAMANDATLISRNLSDFSKIPGLRVEDWTRL